MPHRSHGCSDSTRGVTYSCFHCANRKGTTMPDRKYTCAPPGAIHQRARLRDLEDGDSGVVVLYGYVKPDCGQISSLRSVEDRGVGAVVFHHTEDDVEHLVGDMSEGSEVVGVGGYIGACRAWRGWIQGWDCFLLAVLQTRMVGSDASMGSWSARHARTARPATTRRTPTGLTPA